MRTTHPILLSVTVLLIASLACVLPGTTVVTPDPNIAGTLIAQTVAAAIMQTNQPILPITGAGTAVPTFTPEPPTFTPTITLTPTPIFTSTPTIPLISVSVATNCRIGPGKIYDRVGALMVDEFAEVVARNPTNNYWYIRNPDGSPEFCWLWGEYATLSGNFAALPVFTPPPSPTPAPDFEASFDGLDACTGWWADIRLKNTGGIAFRSASVTLRDTVSEAAVTLYMDGFTEQNGCLNTTTKDTLQPGGNLIISSAPFAYDPTGHKIRATITLCSNAGHNGTCVTKVFTFKP